MAKDPEVRKITMGLIFSWIFSVIFITSAMGAMAQGDVLSVIALLIMGLVLLPPAQKFVREQWKFELSTGIKWLIIIIGLVIVAVSVPSKQYATPHTTPPIQETTPNTTSNQEAAPPTNPPVVLAKTRSADLTIDRVTTQAANLQPIRVTVSNTGDIAISPKFDVAVTDRNGNEVCSGSPMFDEFDSISPGSQQTGEFTILACMFKNDGTYNVKVDLLDSDYSKLNTATKSIAVTYWSQFR